MPAIDPGFIGIVVLAFVGGGLIKGMTGLGMPLVAMPVLATAVELPVALPLMVLPAIGGNVWQVATAGAVLPALLRFWPILLALGAGTWLGVALIASSDPVLLGGLLGAVIILFVLSSFTRFSPRIPPAAQRWLNPVFGGFTGLVGGLTGIFGPAIAMHLLALRIERELFIGALGALILASVLAMTAALTRYGLLGLEELLWSTFALLPLALGLQLGAWLRRRTNPKLFERMVLLVLLVVGLRHLSKAAGL